MRVVEGPVGPQIHTGSTAPYGETLPGEHATHAVGMQSGENLPEGLTSAPGSFNTGQLKTFENTIRRTADAAAQQGAQVETRTVLQIEYQVRNGVEVPVLVGVQREAWVVIPGTDRTVPFAGFKARLDPVTRTVVIDTNWQRRP